MIISRNFRLSIQRWSPLNNQIIKYCKSTSDGEDVTKTADRNDAKEIVDKKEASKKALFELLSSVAKDHASSKESITKQSKYVSSLSKKPDASSSSSSSSTSSTSSTSSDSSSESDLDDKLPRKKLTNVTDETKLAARKVAEVYGGDVDKTEAELLTSFRSHTTTQSKVSVDNLSSIFSGMEVETQKRRPVGEFRREEKNWRSNVDEEGGENRFRRSDKRESLPSINIFEGEPLNIFPEDAAKKDPINLLPTWTKAKQHECELALRGIPRHAFEEKIEWTKEGKLWSFPIDNEAGLEEEKKVKFHEHVFLEKYIADWVPKKGPLKHFMDMVVTGLSKNPYISVERKKAHIKWYQEFFKSKEQDLKNLNLIEKPIPQSKLL